MSSNRRVATGNLAPVVALRSTRHAAPPKRRYHKMSDEQRLRTAKELLRLKQSGALDDDAYRSLEERTNQSRSSLEKLLRATQRSLAGGGDGTPPPRAGRQSKLQITDDVLMCHVGRDLASAHKLAMGLGLIPKCHRTTYADAVYKVITPGELDGLRYGKRLLPRQWVYLDRRDNPLMDQFTIDMFFPRVRCHRADGTTVIPVWVSVRERSRGLLLAWHLFHRVPVSDDDVAGDPRSGPDSAAILALLAQAIRGWTRDGVFCGGLPRALRCDREALFLTDMMIEELLALGIEVDPTNSYSSWENGAHERMHLVIRTEALQGLLASNDGPKTRSGSAEYADVTLDVTELEQRLDRWAHSYNFERVNSAVGATPFDSWCERVDAGDEVRRASNRELATLSLPAGTATKSKQGVKVPGRPDHYSGPCLNGVRNGTTFSIGTYLNDQVHVELFDPRTGAYVGTLERRRDMAASTEGKIMAGRKKQEKRVDALLTRRRETVEDTYQDAMRRLAIEAGQTPQPLDPARERPDETQPPEPVVSPRHATETEHPAQHPADLPASSGDGNSTAGGKKRTSRRRAKPTPDPSTDPGQDYMTRLAAADNATAS